MSSPVATTPVQKEKKPRAPTLPAKYSKFIQFAYWFLQKLNDDSDAPAVDQDLFIEKIHLYSTVDDQKDFVQGFFDESKDVNKTVRLLVKQHTKDLVKAAKADAKAAKVADKPKKERKPRAKKVKDDSPEDAFVNEMVQLANGSDAKSKDLNDKEVKAPKVKAPKDKVVKEKVVKEKVVKDKVVKEKVVKEKEVKAPKEKVVKEKDVKATKEKDVKAPKDKVVKATKATKDSKSNKPDNDLTQVSILNLDDQQFLLDDALNVYDFQNHNLLGKFDPNTNSII
jgi:hypothetical protein